MTKIMTSRLPQVFGTKVFDDIWGNWPFRPSLFEDLVTEERFTPVNFPRIDVKESGDKLIVIAEIPGMKRDDIQVTVHDGTLTISGERSKESEEKHEGYLRREISRGSFKRSFVLPDTVDVEKIDAKYEDGILNIEFPKVEEAKPKQIEVKVH